MSSRRRSLRNLVSQEPEEELPSPRRRLRRSLVIKSEIDAAEIKDDENDGEYNEDDVKVEEDEDDEVDKSIVEEDEEEAEDEEEVEEEEEEEEEEEIRIKKRSRSKSQPVEDDTSKRHKLSPKPTSKDTPDLEIVNDEYELPIDEQGETKVNADGELSAGRQYRIKSFTVHGKDKRLYMLSTELARLMGFRDSYLFFQKHRKLYKYITTDKQKLDLVERGIMPLSYKLRTIGLITARSAFREFGAKIIQNGKQVTDDYYEQQAKDEGGVEGEFAVPPLEYHPGGSTVGNNELSGLSSRQEQQKENSSLEFKKFMKSTPENWIYNIATSTVHLNHFYQTSRPKFMKDPYTNVKFIPLITQPTHCEVTKTSDSKKGELIFNTSIDGDFKNRKFGLSDVDDSIFADCVDEEVREAIIRQRELERNL